MLELVLAAILFLPPQKSDAVIGVSAIHLESGKRLSVRNMERFPMGSVYKFPIVQLMSESTTGAQRIKRAVPSGASVAHKTGTMPGTTNDVALITLPNGEHVALAIFTKASKRDVTADAEADIRAITRKVLAELR